MLWPVSVLLSSDFLKCECASYLSLFLIFAAILLAIAKSFIVGRDTCVFNHDEESPIIVPVQTGWGGYEVVHFERAKKQQKMH
jgi:hypothetical protein